MPNLPSIEQVDRVHLEDLDACPWCASRQFGVLFRERGFSYSQCRRCSLIFLHPRLREENVSLLYDDVAYHADTNVTWERRTGEKRLDLLGELPPGGRIFEDGAGMGSFVAACRRRGFDAAGCDIGLDAVRKAKRLYDLDLHHGPLSSVELPDGSLDVLAGFNLLSHLYHPWDYMRQVARLLKPGGIWFVRTGDRSGIMKWVRRGRWGAPEHTFHYTRRVLEDMAAHADLEIIRSVPAFDSDFPYVLFDVGRSGDTLVRRGAARVSTAMVLAWNLLRLPKDDVFVLLRRSSPVPPRSGVQ